MKPAALAATTIKRYVPQMRRQSDSSDLCPLDHIDADAATKSESATNCDARTKENRVITDHVVDANARRLYRLSRAIPAGRNLGIPNSSRSADTTPMAPKTANSIPFSADADPETAASTLRLPVNRKLEMKNNATHAAGNHGATRRVGSAAFDGEGVTLSWTTSSWVKAL
jgi:hypothetical protein